MHALVARFQRFATVLLGAAVICTVGLASTLSTISATAGSNTCSQSGAGGLSCSVASGATNASATTTVTFDSPGGRLEATTNGEGLSTSASASVSYSNMLVVNGASGSGDLTIQFTGFQDILGTFVGAGTVSPLSVTLEGSSTNVVFPFTPGSFSVTLPVTFGAFEPLRLSFSDTASGAIFMGGIPAQGNADAVLLGSPTFVVTNANGAPISGTTVGFIPEPGTVGLMLLAVSVLWAVFAGKHQWAALARPVKVARNCKGVECLRACQGGFPQSRDVAQPSKQ